MIKVVIVDDSMTARHALRLALESDPQIVVVGEAADGEQAMTLVRGLSPDLVTMDVYLRRENGLDVVSSIMAESPRPVLVVTAANLERSELGYEAIAVGALDILPKLPAPTSAEYESRRYQLIRLVKTLAGVPVVTHFRSSRFRGPGHVPPTPTPIPPSSSDAPSVLCIGASTGGPPVISRILKRLPAPLPAPVIYIQHISPGFIDGFAAWLAQTSGHQVVIASSRQSLEPGLVYVPPDQHHLIFKTRDTIAAVGSLGGVTHVPSIDVLFQTASQIIGPRAVGVLLTGMGRDGVTGLATLRDVGACTIAQSPESCAVDSMPLAAIESSAASLTLAPDSIADFISREIVDPAMARG